MSFRQRNLKLFHHHILAQRILILIVVLNRLTELFRLAQIQDTSPLGGEGWGEGEIKYTYSYDTIYRLTQTMPSKIMHNGKEKEFENKAEVFTYDAVGNRLTGPKDKLNYTYNQGNQLTELNITSPHRGEGGGEGKTSASTSTLTFAFTYDTAGRRTKLTYPNGVTTTYSYDSIGRLTNLLTQYAEIKEQGKKKPPILKFHTIDSFTYTHDKVGNRLSKTDTDTDTKYSYDAIYRLLQSTPAKIRHNDKEVAAGFSLRREETFTYDPVGNRLTGPKDKLNYTYNQGNELTEVAKQDSSPHRGEGWGEGDKKKIDFTYDNNGNLTKKIEYDDDGNIKKITLYTYDFENRLIRVEMQKDVRENIVEFTYDPFGRRLSKSVHREEIEDDEDGAEDKAGNHLSKTDTDTDTNTYYVYDNEDIIMEYNHKGKVRARYIHGAGIDEPLSIERKGKTYYYHFDGLGSVTALTDSKGKVVQRYEYDSFGKLKRHGNKVKNAYTYTAREYDRETGLYYYRARYYDAKVGRFISVDPIVRGINHTEGVSCRQSINRFPLDKPKKLHPYAYTENNPITFIDPSGLGACGPGQGWGERIVPDGWWGLYDFSFSSPCAKHDKCYATCGSSRYACDEEFWRGLKNECSTSAYYADCMVIASIYYSAVRIGGDKPYRDAQEKACCGNK